jgi:hypothetical protein
VLFEIPWELGEHGVTIEYSIETWWEHQNPKIPTIYVFQYSSILYQHNMGYKAKSSYV